MISKHSPDPPRIALEDIPGEVFDQLPPLYPIPPGEAHAADEAIYRQVRRQCGKEVRRIIVTGGGGPYVFKYIQAAFPHAITVSDRPYFSNCEGAYRYAVMKDSRVGLGK